MAVLLVTYDLNQPGHDYRDFHATLQAYPWQKLSGSCYAISTDEPVQAIFDKLFSLVGKDDRLFVVQLDRPWKGLGNPATHDWLHRHLP